MEKNILSRRHFLLAGGAGLTLLRGATQTARPTFEEVPPTASGIVWAHDNAASAEHYLPETMGPGCAFLDYDNDGWMDIYFVNSGPCDFFTPQEPIRNALYKNNRDGTFTDVTEKAGVAGGIFGMGVAVGDYDNDGFPDMFVTAYGRPILYRNNGNGTFTDVSEKAGLGAKVFEGHWSTSAVWFDFDNDGRLDLFVCSFVDYGDAEPLLLRRQQDGAEVLLHPAGLQTHRQPAVPQQRRRHVHRGRPRHRHREIARQGPRRGGRRYQ